MFMRAYTAVFNGWHAFFNKRTPLGGKKGPLKNHQKTSQSHPHTLLKVTLELTLNVPEGPLGAPDRAARDGSGGGQQEWKGSGGREQELKRLELSLRLPPQKGPFKAGPMSCGLFGSP